MTKQEALAILERNADPYLADQSAIDRLPNRRPYSLAAVALVRFRNALWHFRSIVADGDEKATELVGDMVLRAGAQYRQHVREALDR